MKKDSAFYAKKAQILRNLGIEATPISEPKIVGVNYNENHLKAFADGKGMSVEDYIAEIDKQASGKEDVVMPGTTPIHSRDKRAQLKGEVATDEVEESKEETSKED